MWAYRRREEDLSAEQRAGLEELFERIPELEFPYRMRWGITEVFDEAEDAEEAEERLEEYRDQLEEGDKELAEFFATYDRHQSGILAYFAEGKTSGVVEGLNNKARVITKRCYGVKGAQTLWNRLCLDVNWASKAVGWTVQQMRQLITTIRARFLAIYT